MISQDFEVEAEDVEKAMQIAQKKYKNGEFVLAPGNLVCKQMAITKPNEDVTEWVEF